MFQYWVPAEKVKHGQNEKVIENGCNLENWQKVCGHKPILQSNLCVLCQHFEIMLFVENTNCEQR